jgi:hypothetical protein
MIVAELPELVWRITDGSTSMLESLSMADVLTESGVALNLNRSGEAVMPRPRNPSVTCVEVVAGLPEADADSRWLAITL